jgi:hypothetical protein
MVLFADGGGLFFNEWYWGPIGHAIVALPFLGILAFVMAIVSRRWIPNLGHRVSVAAVIIVGGEALVLGGGLYSEYEQPARESRAVARTLDFTAYEPRPLPAPFVLRSAMAGPGPLDAPVLYVNYDAGDGFAETTQEPRPAPGAEANAGRCLLPDAGCHEVRTAKGRTVLIASTARGTNASAVLGGTLVSVLGVDVGEAAVLAYLDSLQPVDPEEIEFSRA